MELKHGDLYKKLREACTLNRTNNGIETELRDYVKLIIYGLLIAPIMELKLKRLPELPKRIAVS